jgi:hypothetical protein
MNLVRKPFNLKPLGARQLGSDAEVKSLVLEIDFTGCSLEATRAIAAQQIVVNVQNEQRKNWADLKPGQVIKVDALKHVPKGGDIMSVLEAMSKEDRLEFLKARGLI